MNDNKNGAPIDLTQGGKKSISEVFGMITDSVCDQLDVIIKQNEIRKRNNMQNGAVEDNDGIAGDDFINQKEFFNDFATDEFINKNIRVRPTSGTTQVDRDDQKSDIFGKGGAFGAGIDGSNQMDEDEKFNQNANVEMEMQRK